MEIPGVDLQFACNTCVCASCLQGKIHPQGSNTCSQGCINCDTQSPHGRNTCAYKLGYNSRVDVK